MIVFRRVAIYTTVEKNHEQFIYGDLSRRRVQVERSFDWKQTTKGRRAYMQDCEWLRFIPTQ